MEQRKFLEACKTGDTTTLKSLDYSKIDIHDWYEYAFRWACQNGHLDVVKYLISLEPDHDRINIHACDEEAFRWACQFGNLDVVKYLISLEPDHNRIDIHAENEHAFLFACLNGHLDVVKYLISLEPDHGHIDIHAYGGHAFRWACENGHLPIVKYLLSLEPDHGHINIHADIDYEFRNGGFHIKHLLIQRDPNYNWKQVNGYSDYRKELEQIVECLTTLHQNLIQFSTDILELNVIGIIKEYLL